MNTPIVTIEEYKPKFDKLLDISTFVSAILWILGLISMFPFVKFASHSVFNLGTLSNYLSDKFDSVYTTNSLYFTDMKMCWILILMFLIETLALIFALFKLRQADYTRILDSKREITLFLIVSSVIGIMAYLCSIFLVSYTAREMFSALGSTDLQTGIWLFACGTAVVGVYNLITFLPALNIFKCAKAHEESSSSKNNEGEK